MTLDDLNAYNFLQEVIFSSHARSAVIIPGEEHYTFWMEREQNSFNVVTYREAQMVLK